MSKKSPVERQEFQQHQYRFAAHIRDPDNHHRPADVEDRRMAIYRDLFYNNVENFVATAFPVLRSITPQDSWHRLVRRFFADHRCSTPYFAEIAQEFLDWLNTERGAHPDDPPFMHELAHYEWVELALQISDADQAIPPLDRNGDLMRCIPLISPVAWHLVYRFPVHRISEDYQPREPGEAQTYLVVYRDRQDEIHFLEINAVTYRLMELLKDNPAWTGLESLQRIAEELNAPQPEVVINHGEKLLIALSERNIIIGTKT
jgi:hypothetical protein